MTLHSDDIDAIMAVMAVAFDPAFGEGWNRRQLTGALVGGNCDYLLIDTTGQPAAAGGTVAGFALTRTILDEQELLLFAVRPGDRGRGLGAMLLVRVIAAARQRGIARLLLEMRRGNRAEGLYRGHGFVTIGERRNYYRAASGAMIDAVTFARELGARQLE